MASSIEREITHLKKQIEMLRLALGKQARDVPSIGQIKRDLKNQGRLIKESYHTVPRLEMVTKRLRENMTTLNVRLILLSKFHFKELEAKEINFKK